MQIGKKQWMSYLKQVFKHIDMNTIFTQVSIGDPSSVMKSDLQLDMSMFTRKLMLWKVRGYELYRVDRNSVQLRKKKDKKWLVTLLRQGNKFREYQSIDK